MKVVKIIPNTFENESRDQREILALQSIGCDVIVIAKESDNPTDHGVETIRLSSRPLIKYISNSTINRFASLYLWSIKVRQIKADIISCHDLICLFIGWLSTLFMIRKPLLIYDSHEFEYARNVNRSVVLKLWIKYLERFLIKRCAFSIMVNQIIAEEVKKLHGLSELPIVVRNIPQYWKLNLDIIKEKKKDFKKKYGIKDSDALIVYQGNLMNGRGIEKSVEALQYVKNAYILFLGNCDKTYKGVIINLAQSNGVEKRIIFHPAVSHSELWKFTGMADVGLCNIDNVCQSYYYSLPNKLFEYIQALVPVVGSDFPEIARVIRNYGIGKCCNPEDPYSIANAINEVIQLKSDATFDNNLKEAKRVLCWENESAVLKEAYLKLIDKRIK